uniref:Lysosomal dipeptide transporter MFSD1 n=1 Tax=Sinocyclocheilus rhinocerous TaxID=307959 RepID=A0A673H6M9_9TELE
MAEREEYEGLLDEEDEDDEGVSRHLSPLCDPTHLLHRILVLLFMCFLGFGSYFCYDNPAALQTQVIQDMSLNTASFMQLYAWYSWPNVVLCFLGGFLLDRVFGIRLGTIIFALFVVIGQVGYHTHALCLLAVIGGESLAVAQNTYAVNWFKGKELNLVFGLQLSMARVGSTVNMNVIGWVYSRIQAVMGSAGHTTLGITLMIAASTCLFSLTCALILGFLDRRAEKILHKEQSKTGEVIKLTDVKDFPFSLWLIFIIFSVLFISKINIVYIISAPASPLLGFMVDRTGRNVLWVMLAVATTLLSHMMLAFTFWNPWIAMCLLGLSYSLLACALWPMVAFVVLEHQLGTAYGFMQSIQNLGLALMSMAAGSILDLKGYLFLEVFFIACLCLALLAVVLLYLCDYYKGNISVRSR